MRFAVEVTAMPLAKAVLVAPVREEPELSLVRGWRDHVHAYETVSAIDEMRTRQKRFADICRASVPDLELREGEEGRGRHRPRLYGCCGARMPARRCVPRPRRSRTPASKRRR